MSFSKTRSFAFKIFLIAFLLKKEHLDEVDLTQMSLFDTVKDDDIIKELESVDIGNMTPLDALNKLYELQNKVKNRW